jgi:hypothetical protein
MSTETKQFLVVFDPSADSVEVEELGTDPRAAMRAYKKREHDLAPDDRIEVVLLGAESIDALKQTHSSYFGSERFDTVLAPLPRARIAGAP